MYQLAVSSHLDSSSQTLGYDCVASAVRDGPMPQLLTSNYNVTGAALMVVVDATASAFKTPFK